MSFDFPASPTSGQLFSPAGGPTYVWNGYAWDAVSGAVLVSFQKFIVAGAFTYTPPANLICAIVECVGGGGGGAGQQGGGAFYVGAAGGGSGGYSRRLLTAAQIGANQTGSVGAGGAGGVATSGAAGGTGGITSFGSLCVANGGFGGTANSVLPGAGASVSGAVGDIVVAGNPGHHGTSYTATGQQFPIGHGGAGPWGGAGFTQIAGSGVNRNGGDATGYGSGGAGATVNNISSVNPIGGAGFQGICFVTEYVGLTASATAITQYVSKAGDTMSGPLTCIPVALSNNVGANFNTAQAFTVTMAAAFTVANPSVNPAAAGAYISITVDMTAAGALTWGNLFKGLASYTQSTWVSGTMRDHLVFRWSGSTYDLVGASRGINQ